MGQTASFIVFDGLDGSGKGTQLKLLIDRAKEEGRAFVSTREPGGVPLSEKIREVFKSSEGMQADALTQFLLVWSARSAWVRQFVAPALEKNLVVFADRCDSSTMAYQVHAKQAPELEREFWRMRELVFGDHTPNLYIILDVPAEVARARSLADSTHTSDFDVASLEWYERTRAGFHVFAKSLPGKVLLIDGARTPEEIHEEVYRIVGNECGW